MRVLDHARDDAQPGPCHQANSSNWDSPAPAGPHAARRPREYLTPKEVERLITAARQNRHGHRDATM
jgi:hypothetical protein